MYNKNKNKMNVDNNTKKKIRIVNKSKEDITIDIRNSGGIIKMSWNIFKSLFDICKDNTKFCVTKEDNNKSYNTFKKLLTNAVYAFSKIKDRKNPDKQQLEILGKCFNDLIVLLNCTKEDLNKLIIYKYNEIIKQNEIKKDNTKKKKQQNNKKLDTVVTTEREISSIPVSTFGDLDALKQLKEKLNDKRGS
jgi:hypothetical protein